MNYNKNIILQEQKNKIINSIIVLENKYMKIYKLNLKYSELFNRKNVRLKNQLQVIKNQINILETRLKKYDDEEYNMNTRKRIPVSKNQIIYFDYKYKTNAYELFTLLRLEENPKKILILLNKLRGIYFNILSSVDKEDYKTKFEIKDILSYLLSSIKEEKEKINNNLEIKTEVVKPVLEKTKKSIKLKQEEKYENSIMPNLDIYNKIINGEDITEYSLTGIAYAFKNIVQKYEINENLIKCSNYIISILDNEENSMDLLYSMLDSVNLRRKKFEPVSKEREILNEIYKNLKNIKNIYELSNKKIENEQTKYLYDIISVLLYDDSCYLPIKKLIKNYPNAVNAKKEGKYIIENIFDFYLDNYEKIITGNKTYYVNFDYIKEIYYLFINNENIDLNSDIINRINQKKEKFLQRVTTDKNKKKIIIDGEKVNTIIVKNEKRKNYIIEELENVSNNYNKEKLEYDLKKVDKNMLNEQINYMQEIEREKNNDVIDLTSEENIVLDNDFVAYNYKSTTSSNIIRISVCDITSLIPEYSNINNYMYNQLLKQEEIDERIFNSLKFKDCKELPAITFKISLDKNNNPIDLYIYKSKIKTKKVCKNNKTYKEILELVNSLIEKKDYELYCSNKEKIEIVLNDLVNKLYLNYAQEKGIPIIYSGLENVKSIRANAYNNLIPILNEIDKNESNNIYKIMTGELGEFHYSSKPFKVEDNYDLNLISKPNYIFLQNQRIIKALVINYFNKGSLLFDNLKEAIKLENDKLITDLNASVDYKNIYDVNQRIKKKTLIL